MANKFKEFLSLLKALSENNVEYVLIGGVAVIIHGIERLTQDIDIFVRMTPENIQKLKATLNLLYQDESIDEITVDELNKYPVIRYGTPNGFYIDIMARLGEAFTFDDLKYEVINYQGIGVKVAVPEILYEMKKNTLRDKDILDAQFLKEIIKAKQAKLKE